jgi:hypothetical protein
MPELRGDAVMAEYTLIGELERVIRMILAYPQGLSVLLGEIPAMSAMEIVEMFPDRAFDSLGIRGGRRPLAEKRVEAADRIDGIIRRAGGWPHIARSVRMWRHENLSDWNMIGEHIRSVRRNRRWVSRAKLLDIADKYRVSAKTVTRKRQLFAGMLAEYILFTEIARAQPCPSIVPLLSSKRD